MAMHPVTTRACVTAVLAVFSATLVPGCGADGPDTIPSFVDDTTPSNSKGVVVAAQGDELVMCEGWGQADQEDDAPFDCDTVVDVMSMTKQFTAAAVLKLEMLDKLSASDSISDHLDDVPEDKQPITVEHLLTHTSGMVGELGGDYDEMSREALVAAAMESSLQSSPGSNYAYSNLGYSLLAVLVDVVSETGYEEFLSQHLFIPAGMTTTGYVLPDFDHDDVAVEYDAHASAQGRPLDHPRADDGPYWNLRGNGGMLSTARDMFSWHVALLGEDVLDSDAKTQLFKPRVREEPDDTYYGYGWVVTEHDDTPVAWHNGGNEHSYGELARTPDGHAMLFWTTTQAVSDSEGWDFADLGADLTGGLLTRLL